MLNLHKIIASAFGIGYIPKGSGTFGALLACLLYLGLVQFTTPFYVQGILISFTIAFTFIGRWSSEKMEHYWGEDASKIVIDEVIGMWLTLWFVPFSWQNLVIAFILFRFYDIYKPFNIRSFEKYSAGWGVMLDDVMAGIWANATLQLLLFFL